MPVDNNPVLFWYNETALQEAGITEMPADLYEQGNWNWDVFQDMLVKLKANNLRFPRNNIYLTESYCDFSIRFFKMSY
ncbi:hypothetical protein [Paenibacillus chungangensis]|uniref:Uncharacterized protein n=1 Tax=Paenibacillus chungangensis TaxID=696535 RepID=A0ABW3HVK2_9BACL